MIYSLPYCKQNHGASLATWKSIFPNRQGNYNWAQIQGPYYVEPEAPTRTRAREEAKIKKKKKKNKKKEI